MPCSMFEELKEWYEAERHTLTEKGWGLHLSAVLGVEVKARYLDLEAPGIAARVTLWETGQCDLEAIASETGRQLFWKHKELRTSDEVRDEMSVFVAVVGANAA